MSTVVVGMSGGVDSSVSALLLKQQGHRVIGLFMKNWEEEDASGRCIAAREFEDVIAVCQQLDIPYYSVNFAKQYWDQVFTHFLEDLRAGFTPNPDTLCNREIKFKVLLEKALELGADYLATGHYCRTRDDTHGRQLLRGLDPGKDQSYFLYAVPPKALPYALFPIGGMQKSEVRAIAKQHGLVTAQKKDSTGICFIGKRNFKEFVKGYLDFSPGPFEDQDGHVIGQHDGTAYYTLGQRKGLGIGGPGEAWFVIGKDLKRNAVILAQGKDHPMLYSQELIASEVSWISPPPLAMGPFSCTAKVRYRQPDQPCTILQVDEGHVKVRFDVPQRAVTPGQAVVFYQGEICLGGGRITNLAG